MMLYGAGSAVKGKRLDAHDPGVRSGPERRGDVLAWRRSLVRTGRGDAATRRRGAASHIVGRCRGSARGGRPMTRSPSWEPIPSAPIALAARSLCTPGARLHLARRGLGRSRLWFGAPVGATPWSAGSAVACRRTGSAPMAADAIVFASRLLPSLLHWAMLRAHAAVFCSSRATLSGILPASFLWPLRLKWRPASSTRSCSLARARLDPAYRSGAILRSASVSAQCAESVRAIARFTRAASLSEFLLPTSQSSCGSA